MALKISSAREIPAFCDAGHATRYGYADCWQDPIHLEVGQPSTPPPAAVSKALQAALGTTSSHGYSVGLGLPELRQRIAGHYQDWITCRWIGRKLPSPLAHHLGLQLLFCQPLTEATGWQLPRQAILHLSQSDAWTRYHAAITSGACRAELDAGSRLTCHRGKPARWVAATASQPNRCCHA